MFAYGMWYGLVYRRAGLIGTAIFGAARVCVLALAAIIATSVHGWAGLGHFFATIRGLAV